jgi:hypothetical protein
MIRISIASTLLVAAMATTNACAKSQTAPATSAAPEASPGAPEHQSMGPGMMGMMNMGDQCPMALPGTTVQATEMSDGMAMTFTTSGDAGELRKRVRSMADRMNDHSSGGMGMHDMMMGGGGMGSGMMAGDGGHGMKGGGMGPGMMSADGGHGMMGGSGMMAADGGHGMMGGMMPPVHAQAEDVAGGARLHMTPLDPSRKGELKQHMQQHAQMMNQAHGCPMMGATQ